MISIHCVAEDHVLLSQIKPFQGDLKRRSAADIDALIQSIQYEGLLMPFAVAPGGNILDGHARFEALTKMALDDETILTQPLPIIVVEARTDEKQRTALLQITSQYGKVTKKGLANFIAPIANYTVKAPVVLQTLKPVKGTTYKTKEADTVVIRLKVRKELAARVTTILSGVEGVEIL